jgi:flagellar L-ring protein precursor FlgH
MRHGCCVVVLLSLLGGVAGAARHGETPHSPLADYLARIGAVPAAVAPLTPGSLWTDSGPFRTFSADYKARQPGDVISVVVVQDTTADNSGSVATARSFQASSGLDGFAGQLKTKGLATLFSPKSSATLAGKSQASSKSQLRTTLAGRVVAELPGGALVVEARRVITFNQETQTVALRGVARPGDISADNSVVSTALSDLEVEIEGRGVLSDGIRRPHLVTRLLLRLLQF